MPKPDPESEVRKRQNASKSNGPQPQAAIEYTEEQLEYVKKYVNVILDYFFFHESTTIHYKIFSE